MSFGVSCLFRYLEQNSIVNSVCVNERTAKLAIIASNVPGGRGGGNSFLENRKLTIFSPRFDLGSSKRLSCPVVC